MKEAIQVKVIIAAPIVKVWERWTAPQHIVKWNYASDEWHTPRAENDLKAGGWFSYRMEAKDGSVGFDFEGAYTAINRPRLIEYTLGDGRKVKVQFESDGDRTVVTETFETEEENPAELQRTGWQAILNHFKEYCENE